MDAIRGMLAPRSAVLRDGRRISVDAADLVPGDGDAMGRRAVGRRAAQPGALAVHHPELLGDEEAEMAQLLIEYDPHPPYDAGHMSKADKSLALRARLKMNRIAATNPKNLLSVPKILLEKWSRALKRARR